VLSGLNDHGYI